MFKRVVSVLLSTLMILSLGDITLFAAGSDSGGSGKTRGLSKSATPDEAEPDEHGHTHIKLDKPALAEINADNEEAEFYYHVEESGYYYFCSDSEYDTLGYVYDSDNTLICSDDDSGYNYNFLAGVYLTEGKTYRFTAKFYGSSPGSFYVKLTRKYDSDDDAHSYDDGTKTPPTCTDKGYTLYTCECCKKEKKADYVDALGHDFVDGVCSRCSTEVKALSLDTPAEVTSVNDVWEYFSFTPDEDGTYYFYSDSKDWIYPYAVLCDDSFSVLTEYYDTVDDGNFKINYNLEKGKTYCLKTSCYNSGKKYFVVVSKDFKGPHAFKATEVVAPSCTEQGYTHYKCENCGKEKNDDDVDALGHDIVDGDCTRGDFHSEPIELDKTVKIHTEEYGQTYYFRFVPDEDGTYYFYSDSQWLYPEANLYDEDLKYLNGTSYGGDDGNFKLQCDLEKGKTYYFSSYYYYQNSEYYVTLSKEFKGTHKYVSTEVVAPSCTEKGYTHYKCENCGLETNDDYVDALGHDIVDGDCTRGDFHSELIELDNVVKIDAEGYDQINYFRFVPDEDGTYYFYSDSNNISTYGAYYDADLKRLGNNTYGGENNNFKLSCSLEAGKTYYFSSKLNNSYYGTKTYYVYLTKDFKGTHKYVSTEVVAPSCTEQGYTKYKCENCGREKNDDSVDALGHDIVDGDCTRCDFHSEPIELDKTVKIHTEENGQTYYFRFVPDEDGTYYFYSDSQWLYPEANLYDEDLKYLNGTSYGGDNGNFKLQCDLEKGKTYYFSSYYYYQNSEYYVTISKEFKGTHKYVSTEVVAPSCTEKGYTHYKCENCGLETNDDYVDALGHDIVDGDCTRCDFHSEPIELDSVVTIYAEDYDQTDYFYFVPDEDGTYYFYSDSNNISTYGAYYDADLKRLGNNTYGGENNNFKLSCSLEAGKTYYFSSKLNNSYGGTKTYYVYLTKDFKGTHKYASTEVVAPSCTEQGYTHYKCENCGIEKDDDYISNLGHDMADGCCTRGDFDSTVIEPEKYYNIENNKEGGIVNFRFVPDEDGTYYFFSDACVQTFARLYDSTVSTQIKSTSSSNGFKLECELEKDKEYYFSTGFSNNSSDCDFYKVMLTRKFESNHKYKLITEREPTCKSSGYRFYVCENCGYNYSENPAAIKHNFVDGKCSHCGEECAELLLDGKNELCVCDYNTQNYYSFTPESDDKYYISVDAYNSVYCYLYDSDLNQLQSKNVSSDSMSSELKAGDTYYFRFSAEIGVYNIAFSKTKPDSVHNYVVKETKPADCTSDEKITYECTICHDSYTETGASATGHHFVDGKCENCDETCEELPLGERVKIDISSLKGKAKFFRFTPETSGDYYTLIDSESNPSITRTVYDSDMNSLSVSSYYSYSQKVNLEASKTYYISVRSGYSSYSSDVYFAITDKEVTDYTDRHEFELVSSTPATCNSDGSDKYTCKYCGYTYSQKTQEQLTHSFKDGKCEHCEKAVGQLKLDEVTAVPSSYETEYFEFVPEEKGKYYFISDSSSDTYGCLYDSEMKFINSDDDSGDEYNFKIYSSLEAGEKYYLSTYGYDNVFVKVVKEYTSCHDYEIANEKEATCTESGYTVYKCKNCEKLYTKYTEDPKGHSNLELIKTVEPDCDSGGYSEYKCGVCGETIKQDEKPAVGHSFVDDKCERCDIVKHELKLDEHKYTDNAKVTWFEFTPDENEDYYLSADTDNSTKLSIYDGTKILNTINNSFNYSVSMAKGKSYLIKAENNTNEEAFCICISKSSISHDYEVTKENPPTCEESGSRLMRCKYCSMTNTEYIPKLNHSFKDNKCERCDKTCEALTLNTPKKLYINGEIKQPLYLSFTPEESGLYYFYSDSDYYCSPSLYTESFKNVYSVISLDEDNSFAKGYTLQKGKTYYLEVICNSEYSVIPITVTDDFKTVHTYVATSTVSPTCTEDGYTEYKCQNCGKTYRGDYVSALGHIEGEDPCSRDNYTAVALTKGVAAKAEVKKEGKTKNFSFTPENSGLYYFYSDAKDNVKISGKLYDSKHKLLSDDNSFVLSYVLKKNHKYYLETSFYNSDSTGDYYVFCDDRFESRHTMSQSKVVEPSCVEQGYTEFECVYCGQTSRDNYTEPVGHKCSTITSTVAPTCDMQGYSIGKCDVCGEEDVRFDYTNPLGHDIHDGKCSRCDFEGQVLTLDTYFDTVPNKENHFAFVPEESGDYYFFSDTSSNNDPYCTLYENNSYIKSNDDGGFNYNFKLGYSLKAGKTYYYYTSSRNNAYKVILTRSSEQPHSIKDVDRKPTCTESGYKGKACENCEYTFSGSSVPPTGHIFNDGHCEGCDMTYTELTLDENVVINNNSDSINDYRYFVFKPEKSATYSFICESRFGHSLNLYSDNYQYTTNSGSLVKKNLSSGKNYLLSVYVGDAYDYPYYIRVKEGEAEIHNYKVSKVVEPTCDEEGYTEHICETCSAVYTSDYISSTGHDYTVYKTEEPSCTKSGVRYKHCEKCNNLLTESIPALGHDYVNGVCQRCGANEPVATPDEIYSDGQLELDVFKKASGRGKHRFTFTPSESDEYYILSDSQNATYVTCELFDGNSKLLKTASANETDRNVRLKYLLLAGHTYTIDITLSSSVFEAFVKVSKSFDTIHSMAFVSTTEPDCINEGYDTYKCEVCGKEEKQNKKDALGHSIKDGKCEKCDFTCATLTENVKTPVKMRENLKYGWACFTPTKTGSYVFECDSKVYTSGYLYNSKEQSVTTYSISHNDENFVFRCALTEGETYLLKVKCNRGYYDSDNNYVYPDSLLVRAYEGDASSFKSNHSFKLKETVPPKCEINGYDVYECEDCGYTEFTNYVDCTGHNVVDGQCTVCHEALYTAILDIEEEQSVDVPENDEQDYTVFRFIASENETLFIYGDTNVSSSINLYNDRFLDVDKNSYYTDYGCKYQAKFEKGKTYYIKIYSFGSPIRVTLSKKDAEIHSYKEKEVVAPSCNLRGYTVYECEHCGCTMRDNYVESLGHEKGELVFETPATCVNPGEKIFKCSRCDGEFSVEIEPHGHSFVDGVCTECSQLKKDLLNPPHDYYSTSSRSWLIVKENAKRIAVTFSTNSNVGSSLTINDGEGKTVKTLYGSEMAGKRVTVQGDTVQITLNYWYGYNYVHGFDIASVQAYYGECEHEYTEFRNKKEPDCMNEGYTGDKYCVDCGEKLDDGSVVPKTDHKYTNGICDNCSHIDENYDIPVLKNENKVHVKLTANGTYRYMFKAPADGEIVAYSLSVYDTIGTLYNDSMEYITQNDDYGEGNNFKFTNNVRAGNTYILETRLYSGVNEEITYDVIIEYVEKALPTEPPTTEPITTDPISTEPGTTAAPISTDPISTEPGTTTAPISTDPISTEPGTTTAPISTDPISTEPGTTAAPISTDPISTEPGTTTAPISTDPISTEPGTTAAPISTDPISTEPGTTAAPISTDPISTEPGTTAAPISTDPISTEPGTTAAPISTDPVNTEPGTTAVPISTDPVLTTPIETLPETPTNPTTITEPGQSEPVPATEPGQSEPVPATEPGQSEPVPTTEPGQSEPVPTTEPNQTDPNPTVDPGAVTEPTQPTPDVPIVTPSTSKKDNPVKISVKKKTIKVKKLKKKPQKIKAIKLKNAQGKVKYTFVKKDIPKLIRKRVSINKKGVITFKKWKKAKKKTFKLRVKITVSGNKTYLSKTVFVIVKIILKK